jgi:hypothetical protein
MHEHLTPAGGTIATCDDEVACTALHCELCLAELSADQLTVPDAQDYVRHFCGTDCLAEWQRRAAKARIPPTA